MARILETIFEVLSYVRVPFVECEERGTFGMANSMAGDWRKTLFVRITEKIKGDMVNRYLPAAWRDRNTLPGLAGNTLLMCTESVVYPSHRELLYAFFFVPCMKGTVVRGWGGMDKKRR